MTRFPEPGRLAAHVLLDSVAAYEPSADLDTNADATNLAFQRLTEIEGAYAVDVDTRNDDIHVDLDLSNVLGASLITIEWLVQQLAVARDVPPGLIISDARSYLDS